MRIKSAGCTLLLLIGVLRPVPASAAPCYAALYPGKTGGARIQNAIHDVGCSTIYVDPVGPDGGNWNMETPITLTRSNVAVRSLDENRLPTLVATGTAWPGFAGMIIVDGQSEILFHRINLQGQKHSYNGFWVRNASRVTIEAGVTAGNIYHGIHANQACSHIEIAWNLFTDNGRIDVRTDTPDGSYHTNIDVHNNSMYGTLYGVALANCGGGSTLLRCTVVQNTIQPKKGTQPTDGSGIDLNRAPYALVAGNTITGAAGYFCLSGIECQPGRGITVDDTQNPLITNNGVEGAMQYGIVLANGAVASNRPWWLSGATVSGNTVRNNGDVGLLDARDPSDSKDHNTGNLFKDNIISGNGRSGCYSNAQKTTFSGNGPQVCPPQGKNPRQ